MKDGIVNTVAKNYLIDFVIMPAIIRALPFVATIPFLSSFVRFLVHRIIDPVADELQKFFNYRGRVAEELAKVEAYKPTIERLRKLEEQGLPFENPAVKEAMDEMDRTARALIRNRNARK